VRHRGCSVVELSVHTGLTGAGPRRFYPRAGRRLSVHNVRGEWRPSGTAAGVGVFAVVWSTPSGAWWAPLHDFEPAAQLHFIAACAELDQEADGRGIASGQVWRP
jgi:hypothetical protein